MIKFFIFFIASLFSANIGINWRTDGILGRGLLLFSDEKFDQYNFVLNIVDLNLDYKTPDVSFFYTLRTKFIFGDAGFGCLFKEKDFKIGLGKTENKFRCEPDYSLIWARELWLDAEWEKIYFQLGLFPFKYGFGISLGNAYRFGAPVDGLSDLFYVDQFRPAFLLTINPDKQIELSCYLSYLNNSYYKLDPYNKLSYLVAFDTKITSSDQQSYARPYILFYKNSNGYAECYNDSELSFITAGVEFALCNNKSALYLEMAINKGQQNIKKFDRNCTYFISGIRQTHLFKEYNNQLITSNQQTEPENLSLDYGNNSYFNDESNQTFYNSVNRFRPDKQHQINGLFACLEAVHNLGCKNICLLTGFVSGDRNPNHTTEEILINRVNQKWQEKKSSNYAGFVGVNQLFEGHCAQAFFINQIDKLNLPLDRSYINCYGATTPLINNLAFLGFTGTIETCNKYYQLTKVGVISYYRPANLPNNINYKLSDLYEYDADALEFDKTNLETILNKSYLLGHYLGTEINLSSKIEIKNNLFLSFLGAIILPGTVYKKSYSYLNLETQHLVNSNDFSSIESSDKYEITYKDKTVILADLRLEFCF